ncbi:hypothetical protein KR093_011364, partial [Drosophila rubida]
ITETKEQNPTYCRNCVNITADGWSNGIYEILLPSYSSKPFRVACDTETRGGGWTIILRRSDGTENFYRGWNAYKNGFGNLDGEFFLGLEKIHALTSDTSMELLVLLEDFDGDKRYESYQRFGIAGEDEGYALNTLSKGEGTAGDSLEKHFKLKFSTFDRNIETQTCGAFFNAAWWYHNCHESQLTGLHGNHEHGFGINWYTFRGHKYSMKKAVMMIRPR